MIGQNAFFRNTKQNNHIIDRIEMLQGKILEDVFTSAKPYLLKDVYTQSKKFEAQSIQDKFNKKLLLDKCFELRDDSHFRSKKTFLNHFFEYNAYLFGKKENDYQFFVNPIAYFNGGYDWVSNEKLYQNTRGIVVRGSLANKLGFYSEITENQALFPEFVREKEKATGALPNHGFYKDFGNNAYDFFGYKGYINFKALPPIDVQFGHDQNFIGNGKRSLILGDFAPPHLFLKLNTKIKKVNYMNLFSEHSDLQRVIGNGSNQNKKYSALHHLSINFGKKINLGLFEQVIFSRQNSNQNNGFEPNYLNPIIFYRGIEQNLNSSDNVLLGSDFKYLIRRNMSLYGQFVLDEFKLSEIKANKGWWANKWALQAGVKAIDIFGVNNLDFLLEYNQARPYTYTHFKSNQNLVHYRQPLAHPLGTNFKETLLEISYQVKSNWTINWLASFMQQGIDSNIHSKNIGGNILRDYGERAFEYGNKTLQGNLYQTFYSDLWIQFQFNTFAYLDLSYTFRKNMRQFPQSSNSLNQILSISIRYFIDRNVPLY